MTVIGNYSTPIRKENTPCVNCGRVFEPGWLYLVGPPPRHVVCPDEDDKWAVARARLAAAERTNAA